jgi:methenyltetrahydromethanopterin cyclohydrolase
LLNEAWALGVAPTTVAGASVLDAGVRAAGSLRAGLIVARVCLADLAEVSLVPARVEGTPIPSVVVEVRQPVAACMASQYAGWRLTGADGFFAMGSGPMRAASGTEALFDDIGFRERPGLAVGVLESGSIPSPDVIAEIAHACGTPPERLLLIAARTASLVGSVQVVARSVETAMHKLHAIGFDLGRIVAGLGSAPLPPVAGDDLAGIGRTNDAILYGGEVVLMARGDDDTLRDAAQRLPSCSSPSFGEPFSVLFARAGYDFYKLDPMLFSPACVALQNLDTGRCFRAGVARPDVVAASFFG